jgi:hypothetical protein
MGSPTGIIVTAKRLLIAGCMVATDANYMASVEVHVPQMCAAVPQEMTKGCLFPGASNYAPGSNQVGETLNLIRTLTLTLTLTLNLTTALTTALTTTLPQPYLTLRWDGAST